MLPHIDIAPEVVTFEVLARGLVGTSDPLPQHLALGQAVVVRQSVKRKMGDKTHFDVQTCAHPVAAMTSAVLGLALSSVMAMMNLLVTA